MLSGFELYPRWVPLTHSIFQMWVDFPEVDFLTTTPKYRMKKRNSPSWVHVLLKTSRSIREFYVLRRRTITVDDAYSELFPVLLAFFLTTFKCGRHPRVT